MGTTAEELHGHLQRAACRAAAKQEAGQELSEVDWWHYSVGEIFGVFCESAQQDGYFSCTSKHCKNHVDMERLVWAHASFTRAGVFNPQAILLSGLLPVLDIEIPDATSGRIPTPTAKQRKPWKQPPW